MNGTPFLSARHVTKTFGATQALRGVDIEILAGEMVAIVGPSGLGALNEKDAMSDFRVLYHAADRRRRHRRSAVCGGCEQPIMRGQ